MKSHPGATTFPKKDVWNIVKEGIVGYTNAAVNIKRGFEVTGIYPLNQERLIARKLICFHSYLFLDPSHFSEIQFCELMGKFFIHFIWRQVLRVIPECG